jgi:RNA polymerase sigma-70 factor (ECF subfamily)
MKPLRRAQFAGNNGSSGPHAGRHPGPPWPWEHLHQRCLRETSRILRRREDAEEAAQEALLRAWRLRHHCRGPDTRAAWVVKIARNEAFRLQAGRRRRVENATIGLPWQDSRGPRSFEEEALGRLAWQDALGQLEAGERALLTLRYAGDMSQSTLAELLDMPESTVRVRLHRIRNRLGQVIGPPA